MLSDLTIQTVFRNFATKLILWALGVAAGSLVSHGLATEDQVNQLIGPLAQIAAGAVMAAFGVGLTWYRARQKRNKELGIRSAEPAAVPVK